MGLSIDFSDELSLLDSRYLKGYKVLIILRDGMIWPNGYGDESSNAGYVHSGSPAIVSDPPLPRREAKPVYWITAQQGKAVKEFVEGGGGALFYHNTTYISPHNRDFRDVLGAVTEGHPPIRPFQVEITNKDHPITRGVSDFIVTDEQHFVKYEKDPKYILMRSVNQNGLTWKDLGASSAAGWAYDYGKGRVCYLAPGHMITALWNPEYEKIQRNAVKWLLREL
jgi:type 1 glutamine amidotransferase